VKTLDLRGGECLSPLRSEYFIISSPKNANNETYKTLILRIVLHECGTWYLIIIKERRSMTFENRALRRIYVPKTKEVVVG
jgi:hypothetical protein